MTIAEKVNVASEGPNLVVERSQVMVLSGEGTRDDKSGDTVRIERLKGSIIKIQGQIEQTRKELDGVCEVLRVSAHGVGDGSATDSNLPTNTPSTTPTATLTNEEILEQARIAVNGHIKMLTRYNQFKDVAMVLFELLAEFQGKRVGEVLREREVEVDD